MCHPESVAVGLTAAMRLFWPLCLSFIVEGLFGGKQVLDLAGVSSAKIVPRMTHLISERSNHTPGKL